MSSICKVYNNRRETKIVKGKNILYVDFGNFQKNELLKVDQHRGTFDSPKPQRQPKVSSTYIYFLPGIHG